MEQRVQEDTRPWEGENTALAAWHTMNLRNSLAPDRKPRIAQRFKGAVDTPGIYRRPSFVLCSIPKYSSHFKRIFCSVSAPWAFSLSWHFHWTICCNSKSSFQSSYALYKGCLALHALLYIYLYWISSAVLAVNWYPETLLQLFLFPTDIKSSWAKITSFPVLKLAIKPSKTFHFIPWKRSFNTSLKNLWLDNTWWAILRDTWWGITMLRGDIIV